MDELFLRGDGQWAPIDYSFDDEVKFEIEEYVCDFGNQKWETEDFIFPKDISKCRGSKVEKLPEGEDLFIPAQYLSKKFMLKYFGLDEESQAISNFDRAMKVVDAN